jgi:K+-sensing histidine kinase KdpD
LSEQLNQQKLIIQKQNERLEKLVTTKDKLFSIIGHDLRSPFCIQSSLSEYLIYDYNEIEKEALLDTLQTINKTANNGLGILSNLMDWSRSQNNRLEARPVDVSVLKIVVGRPKGFKLKRI